MDTVALLGPNIQYDLKNTFVYVEVPRGSSRRASSAPCKYRFTAIKPVCRPLPPIPARRCLVTPIATKPLRIHLEKELACPFSPSYSQCSTAASTTCSRSDASDTHEEGATIRIGNLPNRAKPDRLKAFCDDLSLGECVDSIYIPLDAKTGVGKGYAFVHFVDEDVAAEFAREAEGRCLPRSNSPKQMTITYASRQAAATIPKHLPKHASKGRTFTAFLWLRNAC